MEKHIINDSVKKKQTLKIILLIIGGILVFQGVCLVGFFAFQRWIDGDYYGHLEDLVINYLKEKTTFEDEYGVITSAKMAPDGDFEAVADKEYRITYTVTLESGQTCAVNVWIVSNNGNTVKKADVLGIVDGG